MIRITSLLLATSLVVSGSPLLPRTAAQVESDLNTIISDTNSLDSAINALSTEGFVGIGPLEETTSALLSQLQTSITDAANTGQLDETDGEAVLSLVEQLEPAIVKTLGDLVDNIAQIEADNAILPGTLQFVQDELNSLASASTEYESNLIDIAPADLKATASSIADTINVAFSSAIAAYATAT